MEAHGRGQGTGQVVSYMGEESPVPRGQRAQRLSCLKNGAEAGLAGEVGRGWALVGDEVRDVRARPGYTDWALALRAVGSHRRISSGVSVLATLLKADGQGAGQGQQDILGALAGVQGTQHGGLDQCADRWSKVAGF